MSPEQALPHPRTSLRIVAELAASEGWQREALPFLKQLLEEHTEAALSVASTPAERSDHVRAVHVIRAIINFPSSRKTQLESQLKFAR